MKRIAGAGCSVLGALAGLMLLAGFALGAEQTGASAAAPPSAAAKLQALEGLLADPEVRSLLARRDAPATERQAPGPAPSGMTMTVSLADRLQGLRAHLVALGAASATFPSEIRTARSMVRDELARQGRWAAAALLIGFVALGYGAEAVFRYVMRPAQRWLLALELQSVNERVRAVFHRLAYGVGLVVSFGLGSVGSFLLFDWPAVIKEALLGYLLAYLLARLCAVAGRILLAPGAPRFRVVPVSTEAARFLFKRWIILAVIAGVSWQTIGLLTRFGLSPLSAELLGDAAALLAGLVGIETIWRLPPLGLPRQDHHDALPLFAGHRPGVAAATTLLVILLWVLWAARAVLLFDLVAFAVALPLTIMVARRSINHILRPPGTDLGDGEAKTLDVIVFERGIRSVVLVGAALVLAHILDVDFTALAMNDTLANRVLRGAVSVVVIGLLADFLWHVLKALIDRKIAVSLRRNDDTVDPGHAARLQTLLPIVSNILLVVIVVLAGMMMLAATGVEIGPLIASAGVVGVAVGFGAQTLVRDIISGIFYLFDDAFRIGEYIQSGSYKGTVESFSLRSVKLRHQRGALYTVPFGVLGAVQNQSRDWVVDKIVLNVPYGTDLDRVRKLIKKIGATLAEDDEFAPDILEPLKMQGVVQFGDYAIQIQTKMRTKPGDVQFLARRRALLLINETFAANGIGFAVPVVHVAGNGEAAAAAQKGFELLQAAKPG